MFLGYVSALKLTGKSAQGNDGGLKLVREIIYKVVSEYLNSVKVCSHAIEGSLKLAEFRDRIRFVALGNSRFEVAVRYLCHPLAYFRESFEHEPRCEGGKSKSDKDT